MLPKTRIVRPLWPNAPVRAAKLAIQSKFFCSEFAHQPCTVLYHYLFLATTQVS